MLSRQVSINSGRPVEVQPPEQAAKAAPFWGPRSADRLALLGLFTLAVALRLWHLGERDLWIDELSSLGYAAQPADRLFSVLTHDPNMVLYYLLLAGWVKLVGVGASEALLRLPSALLGATAAPLIYQLGCQLHSRRAGLCAAVLLSTNGYHIAKSQELRGYSAFVLVTLLSYLLLQSAARQERLWLWLGHAGVSVVAFGLHLAAGFSLASQGLYLLACRQRKAFRGFTMSCGLALAASAPLIWLYLAAHDRRLAAIQEPTSWSDLAYLLMGFAGGEPVVAIVYAALVVTAVAPLGSGRPRRTTVYLLTTWLLTPLVLLLLISVRLPIFVDRYAVAMLPAIVLLAGIGLARLDWRPRLLFLGLVAALSMQASQTVFLLGGQEGWRDAANFVRDNADRTDGLIFVSRWGQNGFEYYAGWRWQPSQERQDRVFQPLDWPHLASYYGEVAPRSLDELPAFAAAHRRIWVVETHAIDHASQTNLAAPLKSTLVRLGYRPAIWLVPKIQLILFERPDGSAGRPIP